MEDVDAEATKKKDVEEYDAVVDALLAFGSSAIEGDGMVEVHSTNIFLGFAMYIYNIILFILCIGVQAWVQFC